MVTSLFKIVFHPFSTYSAVQSCTMAKIKTNTTRTDVITHSQVRTILITKYQSFWSDSNCIENLTRSPFLKAADSSSTPVMQMPRPYSMPPRIMRPRLSFTTSSKATWMQKVKQNLLPHVKMTTNLFFITTKNHSKYVCFSI